MKRAGNIAVLMVEDLDYLVNDGDPIIVIPEGCTRLMLHADLVEKLKEEDCDAIED
jgi:hypothetical protein